MKITLLLIFVILAGGMMCLPAGAQSGYTSHKSMMLKAESLAIEYPSLCSYKSLLKTDGNSEIAVITIGSGDRDSKPAIAVIGGTDGSCLIGRELVLGFGASLLKESATPEIKALLDKVTFYIFPDVSPDASEQYFREVKYERSINAVPTDDDRDFSTDEDPFEDLDRDGFITMIRVSDPAGTYTENTDDKRVMVQADLSQGETGSYFIYSEGIDNDKDGSFNEDGSGGVSFNKNLTYNYEEFGSNAGLHPVSEPETRAVLDFLFDHFNIYATFAFGPQDNLNPQQRPASPGGMPGTAQSQPSSQEQPSAQQGQMPPMVQDQFPMTGGGQMPSGGQMRRMMGQNRKITSVQKSDEAIVKLVSDKYREITGSRGTPPVKNSPGNFMEWSYYHYGRYSFGTPAWWVTAEKDKNAEAAFLKYAGENKMEDVFVPWTAIDHPDFPGKKTEVGGIKPFAMTNPPSDKIEELVSKNYKFIIAVAGMHPELEFLDTKIENIGENVFRVSLKLHNKGIFATCTEAGQNNLWTRLIQLRFEPAGGQKFLSGQKVQRVQRLEGGAASEFSWLIHGRGTIRISAGAANTGTVTTTLELK
ncbi:MAG: M14 family metallopeptidase [Bacteroidota bacterium]